jgi:NAD-dependent dihydropyrimidine dehydrogenase PreA subunit
MKIDMTKINQNTQISILKKRQVRSQTEFIRFDSRKCKACWKCIEICPENVFGKINVIIHKHMKIANSSCCIGCMKCVKACSFDAILSL